MIKLNISESSVRGRRKSLVLHRFQTAFGRIAVSDCFFAVLRSVLQDKSVLHIDLVFPVDSNLLDVWVEVVLILLNEHCEPDSACVVLTSLALYLISHLFANHSQGRVLRIAKAARNDVNHLVVSAPVWVGTSLTYFDVLGIELYAWFQSRIYWYWRAG